MSIFSFSDDDTSYGTYDQLSSFFLQMVRLSVAMPFCRLDYRKRREASGQLMPDGRGLVDAVASALSNNPSLYPDVKISGTELYHQQRCAAAWLAIRDGLRFMAQIASDTYLHVQAGANRQAMSVVRQVHDGGRFKLDGKDITGARHAPLIAAYVIVNDYYQSIRKTKAVRRQQAQAGAPKAASKKPSLFADARDEVHRLYLRLLQKGLLIR